MTAVGVLLAEPASNGTGRRRALPLSSWRDAKGGTAVIAQTAGFGAVFLLAVFIATVASELTRGTFRTMLLQQPARGRVLAGKLVAIIGFTAALALVAEAIGWVPPASWRPGRASTRPLDVDRPPRRRRRGLGRLVVFIAGWCGSRRSSACSPDPSRSASASGVCLGRTDREHHRRRWTPGQQFFPGMVLGR